MINKLNIKQIRDIVDKWDNVDKLNEGYFYNYSGYGFYDEGMNKTVKLLNTIWDEGIWNNYAKKTQNFHLLRESYMPSAAFHHYFSFTQKTNNQYPRIYYEISSKRQQATKALSIIREAKYEKLNKSSNGMDSSYRLSNLDSHSMFMLGSR